MLENLPKEVFSSFRIVYVAYVLLMIFGSFEKKVSITSFFVISGILMFFTILHDDYLRYKLNKWGRK